MKVVSPYYWSLNKNISHTFEVDVWLYDTQKEMLDDYNGMLKGRIKKSGALAIFVPGASNGKYIGSIRLNREQLTIENVIHEAFHAGIETMNHLGRHLSRRYEEKIVSASAQLAEKLVNDYILKDK